MRARDIVLLAINKLLPVTDYFLIATGTSRRQLQSVADRIRESAEVEGLRPSVEGFEEAQWVLLDLGPVVVHLFTAEKRGYYDLELLWGDAPKVDWRPDEPSPGAC